MESLTSMQRAIFILLPLLFVLCSIRTNGYTIPEVAVQPFTVKVVNVKEEVSATVTYLIGVKCHGSHQLETLRQSDKYGLQANFSILPCECFDVIVAKLRKNAKNRFEIVEVR